MPASPDSRYCLQGAVDALQITPDIKWGVVLGDIDLDALVDQAALPDSADPAFEHRQISFAEALTEQVLAWRQQTSRYNRAVMAIMSVQHSSDMLREVLWEITGALAEAYLFSRGWPLQKTIYGAVMPARLPSVSIPDIQSLRLPYLVTARLATDDNLRRAVALLRAQHARNVEALAAVDLDKLLTFMRLLLFNGDNRRYHRRLQRQTRKAVRRGLRAMQRLVGPRAYQGFISADGFVITGCRFDYRVRKRGSLLAHTADPHGHIIPYRLSLLDKQGRPLASGCVTFAATPVLDQVIALALHVRDREAELELLQTANWINFTAQARSDKTVLAGLLAPAALAILADEEHTERDLHDLITARSALDHFDTRFYRSRKRIMTAIERDTNATLSRLIGIPKPIYQYMQQPGPFPVFDAMHYAAMTRTIGGLFAEANQHGANRTGTTQGGPTAADWPAPRESSQVVMSTEGLTGAV